MKTDMNKIISVYNPKKFLSKLRQTLLYNIIKMLFIIFIILSFLFLFMPHRAFVNYDSSDIDSFSIHASDITAHYNNVEYCTLKFTEYDTICLKFGNAQIDNTDIQGEFSLIIKFLGHFRIVPFRSDDLGNFNYSLITGVPQNIIVQCDTNNDDYNYINISMDYEEVICFTKAMKIFDLYDAELSVLYDGKIYKLDSLPSFTPLEGNGFYINVFNYKNSISTSGDKMDEEILLGEINNVKAKTSGTLNFIYTPDGKQYNLINQELLLVNQDNSIESYIKRNDKKVNIQLSGNVDKAYISSLDLFPTFRGWYRDNIYLIPLTLVSTIFGAIKLKKNEN